MNSPRPTSPYQPPAPVETDPTHPLPTPGGGSLEASIEKLRAEAAQYRQLSLDWLLVDSVKARRLLIHAEGLEKRVVLLEAASRVGAPATHRPFTYFLGAGKK